MTDIIEIEAVCYCGHADIDHHNVFNGVSTDWDVCSVCDCPQFRDEDEICEDCRDAFCEC